MRAFIIRRLFTMIPLLFMISFVSFVIIQLPPGDVVTRYLDNLREQGAVSIAQLKQVEALQQELGLDQPLIIQYVKWMSKILRGNFGWSFHFQKPVADIIWQRLGLTLIVTASAMLFSWVLAFPIGIYSAVRQHTLGDYLATFIGFIGLAIPNFMLALILMYFTYVWFGFSVGGLFSSEFIDAPWSVARALDLMKHLWVPMIVVGTAGTAGLIRVLRNNLLDELRKPYVTTARAKGVNEFKLIWKYPLRIAINPFVSTAGWLLPALISGATITAMVLNLPTAGEVLLQALLVQDMYLAGAIIMLLAALTVIGTLFSDILLALIDPRIKYE